MHRILTTLAQPRWRLVLRLLLIVVFMVVLWRAGIWWGFLVPIAILLAWANYYDFSHKSRGGWRAAPMGSFAVVNNADPTVLINERGDNGVDPTGRTYGGPTRVPTVEEQATVRATSWDGLFWVVVEVIVLAGLFLLAAFAGHGVS